jgi:hypothetical protein
MPRTTTSEDPLFEAIYVLKEALMAKYATVRPELLYHYTTPQACFAILDSPRRRLWASSIIRQNDSSEMRFSSRLIGRIAVKMFPNVEWLREVATPEKSPVDTTVVSFCGKADLLSQWRAYGKGGGGCAIGFDANGLASTHHYQLRPVIYKPKAQKELIEGALVGILKILKQYDAPHPECFATIAVQLLAPWLKHPSFAEEHEWRLVGFGPRLKFRAGNEGVIPYSEVTFNKAWLKELWLGPTSDVRMNKQAWDVFLGKKFGRAKDDTPKVTIKTSAIPLRRLDIEY